MRTDLADVKLDVRSLRDKLDAWAAKLAERIESLGDRISGVEHRLDAKIDREARDAVRLHALGARPSAA